MRNSKFITNADKNKKITLLYCVHSAQLEPQKRTMFVLQSVSPFIVPEINCYICEITDQ